ncbi:hypothetical protein [Massilia mucilaginosa]|nr:hypothetical protein [Massilia mucilaginosa]
MKGLTAIMVIGLIGIFLFGDMYLDQPHELAEARVQLANERAAHQQLPQQLQQQLQRSPATLPPRAALSFLFFDLVPFVRPLSDSRQSACEKRHDGNRTRLHLMARRVPNQPGKVDGHECRTKRAAGAR